MDIKRLKEIRDFPLWAASVPLINCMGEEASSAVFDILNMLPEIIDRLIVCRNCRNYVPQDQWTEVHRLGVIDVYDPAYCSKKLPNFNDYDSTGLNSGSGKCEGFEFE